MTVQFIFLLLGAYLLGAVPVSYLIAKYRRGVDLRSYGSGHVGAGNLRRTVSMKVAVAVAVYDFFKGVLVVVVAILAGMSLLEQVAVALAVVVGHNWPVFLRFNGGRGVVTIIGVSGTLFPWGIPVFFVFALLIPVLKGSSLPVLLAFATLPVASWIAGEPLTIMLGLFALFLVMVIRRLTAPRSAISASLGYGELLLNRLLFDRDIRDGKIWVSHQRRGAGTAAAPVVPEEKQEKD